MQRVDEVDEVDEVPVNKPEQSTKHSRIESYDAQIVPRYKEAVLTAWDAFQGFSSRKSSQEFSDVRSRTHQVSYISFKNAIIDEKGLLSLLWLFDHGTWTHYDLSGSRLFQRSHR